MLTPVFQCEQDDEYVIVTITLSAICKALEASFDIVENQFTFFCRPYYLRLKFVEMLTEGKGERATYDLETNQMRVWVPKEVPGQHFTSLDNPAFLIATEKERARIAAVVSGETEPLVDGEEETEFVQTLTTQVSAGRLEEARDKVTYGFANHFSGLFRNVDEDIVSEMVSLPSPESTTAAQRRAMRLAKEQQDFDEEALVVSHEDSEREVETILRYVPEHVRVFQRALQSQGVRVYSAPPLAVRRGEDAYEEEETTLLHGTAGDGAERVEVWRGNVADFKRPVLIAELDADGKPLVPTGPEGGEPNVSNEAEDPRGGDVIFAPQSHSGGVQLAIPSVRPELRYTQEENRVLTGVRMPRLLFRPSASSVAALTLDILFAEAYDDLFTEGQGCCESVWNLCTLSPALSYLDPAATLYEACVAFARRALTYPLHRHFELVRRVFAVVGTRLLLGRQYVLRALLRVYAVLSHSEHRHVLDTIFLEPLIAYWLHLPQADEVLTAVAIELHEHVTRSESIVVQCRPEFAEEDGAERASSLLRLDEKKTLEPITLFSLGLPFAE